MQFELKKLALVQKWVSDLPINHAAIARLVAQQKVNQWKLIEEEIVENKLELTFEYVVPPHKDIFREV